MATRLGVTGTHDEAPRRGETFVVALRLGDRQLGLGILQCFDAFGQVALGLFHLGRQPPALCVGAGEEGPESVGPLADGRRLVGKRLELRKIGGERRIGRHELTQERELQLAHDGVTRYAPCVGEPMVPPRAPSFERRVTTV